MIRLSFDAEFINSVINHPDVREGAEIKGIADVTSLVEDRDNVLLETKHGGFLLINKGLGIYELHSQFLPSGRGLHVVEAGLKAFHFMFLKTDCTRVITKASPDNVGAHGLAEKFFTRRGFNQGYHYYSCDIEQWIERDEVVKQAGEHFHELVKETTNHDDDDVHDCYAGFAYLTAQSGNIEKGQYIYNRWAVMSNYETISIERRHPLVAKVGDMRFIVDNGEVSLCQPAL